MSDLDRRYAERAQAEAEDLFEFGGLSDGEWENPCPQIILILVAVAIVAAAVWPLVRAIGS